MSDHRDLPFISLPDEMEETSKTFAPKSAVLTKPAAEAASGRSQTTSITKGPRPEAVEMVSRPSGKGTAWKQPQNPAAKSTLVPPSGGTVSEAEKRHATAETRVGEPAVHAASGPLAPISKKPEAAAPSAIDKESDLLLQQHRAIEEALRNYGPIKREREDLRVRVAMLEHELAQTRQQVAELRVQADKVKELQEKLDASLLSHSMLSTENAKLKMRLSEVEDKLKQSEQRAQTTEGVLKKMETALQNAKEARDDAERRIAGALAALQARPRP
ncbi:MAG: hypothetical protein HYY16_09255 [Planctomycetes bacterium]|nr:hypothetical protein [Planctomycetota bacterium]